jgi:hypothetical protein
MQNSQEDAVEAGSGERKRRREESDEEVDDDPHSCWKPNFNSCTDVKDVLSRSDSISDYGEQSRSWSGPKDLNQSFSSSGTQLDHENMKREESGYKSCSSWENSLGAERPNSWESSVGAERPCSREGSVGAERPNTPESSVGAERPSSRDGRKADGAGDQPQVNQPEDRGVIPGGIFRLSFGFYICILLMPLPIPNVYPAVRCRILYFFDFSRNIVRVPVPYLSTVLASCSIFRYRVNCNGSAIGYEFVRLFGINVLLFIYSIFDNCIR